MTFSYKTDYTAEGLDRLLSTLKSEGETRTKLEELIASYVDQCQALEDAAFPLIDELSIDGATGAVSVNAEVVFTGIRVPLGLIDAPSVDLGTQVVDAFLDRGAIIRLRTTFQEGFE